MSLHPVAAPARIVEAAGTTFGLHVHGDGGAPLLVIHGAGEDAEMLVPFAERLARAGRRVLTYDRRGTGRSGREDWPGNGADQHADDAAALVRTLDLGPVQVVGLSSGGVVALALAIRHPALVEGVFVWEAPVVGVVPGGDAANARIMGPVDAHLADHPGDFAGAQAVLLSAILGFPVTVDDPRFAAARANAEPMIRDEPNVAAHRFDPDDLAGLDVTIAVGTAPNEIVEAAAVELSRITGRDRITVDTADHEVYLDEPAVLADAITGGHHG